MSAAAPTAAAASSRKVEMFPFDEIVPKDFIPWPDCVKDPYQSHSCPFTAGTPLQNCCFIESSMHILLRNPCLRFFVQQFYLQHRTRLMQIEHRPPRTNLHTLVLTILAIRLNAEPAESDVTNLRLMPYYDQLRRHLGSDRVVPGVIGSGKGDASELLKVTLSGLNDYIRMVAETTDSQFARLYLAYGTRFIFQAVTKCMNDKCSNHLQQETAFFASQGLADRFNVRDVSKSSLTEDHAQMIKLDPANVVNGEVDLQEELKASLFSGRWHMPYVHCACGSAMIRRIGVVNLPWLLYVDASIKTADGNSNTAADRTRYVIRPFEHIRLGPTTDGTYATYKLIARVNHIPGHFHADVEVNGAYVNKDFQREKSADMQAPDRNSMYFLFQRED
jgi:hypothetical protein